MPYFHRIPKCHSTSLKQNVINRNEEYQKNQLINAELKKLWAFRIVLWVISRMLSKFPNKLYSVNNKFINKWTNSSVSEPCSTRRVSKQQTSKYY